MKKSLIALLLVITLISCNNDTENVKDLRSTLITSDYELMREIYKNAYLHGYKDALDNKALNEIPHWKKIEATLRRNRQ